MEQRLFVSCYEIEKIKKRNEIGEVIDFAVRFIFLA